MYYEKWIHYCNTIPDSLLSETGEKINCAWALIVVSVYLSFPYHGQKFSHCPAKFHYPLVRLTSEENKRSSVYTYVMNCHYKELFPCFPNGCRYSGSWENGMHACYLYVIMQATKNLNILTHHNIFSSQIIVLILTKSKVQKFQAKLAVLLVCSLTLFIVIGCKQAC